MSIFTKKIRILGRSKKLMLISDIIFLLLISVTISYYTYTQINKLEIKPIIIDAITQRAKDKNVQKEVVMKNPVEIKCSEIKLNSYALYYNKYGDQLGIGPIPPAVGIPTNYWVFFEIQNGENSLKNINLYTNLPYNVNYTGNKSIPLGNITINSDKQLNWSGINIEKKQKIKLAFEISLIPKEKSIGKILNIIENTKILATDELCDKQISISGENLDTNLKYDVKAKNQGIIIQLK